MARAVGLGSMFRGKIGTYVGYLTKNSRGRYVQSVKTYQPVVANPQTYAQALARLPLGPTQRFYNALAPIIQRGFEGVAYGDPSKNAFLSYNLSHFRGPYLTQDEVALVPGPFLISRGSLASVGIVSFWDDEDNYYISTSLVVAPITLRDTCGVIYSSLLKSNNTLQQGDQVTIVYVLEIDGEYQYHYFSFFLDPTDTTPNTVFATHKVGAYQRLSVLMGDVGDIDAVTAAAVIVSRPYGTTGFRRSTSFLSLNPDTYHYQDETALRAAVASYRDAADDNTDWEDDPTPEYQKIAYLMLVDVTDTIAFYPAFSELAGVQCLGYVTKGGLTGVFYRYSPGFATNCLVDAKGAILTHEHSGAITPIRYNGTYQPAREYNESYGYLNT